MDWEVMISVIFEIWEFGVLLAGELTDITLLLTLLKCCGGPLAQTDLERIGTLIKTFILLEVE